MDHFLEEVVIKKNRTGQEILFYLSNVLMVLSALVGFWMLSSLFESFSIPLLVITLIFCGIAVLLFFKKDDLRTEFEYTFTNGDLDFAKVMNNNKRKNLGTMRVKNVEAFGSVKFENFRKLINMPNIKRRNWFLNREANLYYFYYQKESNKTIIVFEPTDEMVTMIKKYLPHGIYTE